MADSKNITVTNYRLKQALANAEAEEMEKHAKKMGEELKSSLSLKLGKVLMIYPNKDKAKVQLLDNKRKETVLLAHDFISGGMNINAYPKGKNTSSGGRNVIIPSDDLYGVIMHTSDEKYKILLSYVDLGNAFTRTTIKTGEYRMQVGENLISITDKYINMKAENFFINGLPYTEAYTPLTDYYNKDEVKEQNNLIDEKISTMNKTYMVDAEPSMITSAEAWENTNNGRFQLRRQGNTVIIGGGFTMRAKYTNTGWKTILEIPKGYRAEDTVWELGNTSSSAHWNNTRINNGFLQVYCNAQNTEYTEHVGVNGTWIASDDPPQE